MIGQSKGLRYCQLDNCEPFAGATCCAPPSAIYKSTLNNSAADPFTSKINKYAESGLVRVWGTVAFTIKFGDAAPTADAGNHYVAANLPEYIVIDPMYKYASVFSAASGSVYVEEIY
jgi:hypothetical protein